MSSRQPQVHFSAAPWPRGLKILSFLGTLAILAGGVAAYRAVPALPGFTHVFGLGVALVLPGILVYSIFFMVTGYTVSGSSLYIHRLLSSTRISLDGLSRVFFEPAVCKGSFRIFGNGGLYSFTGVYRNKKIGRYRLFGTDLSRSVVLMSAGRTIVITPGTPHAFIEHLRRLFPTVKGEPPGEGKHS